MKREYTIKEAKKLAEITDTIIEISREVDPDEFVAVLATAIEGWELETGQREEHIKWLAEHLALRVFFGGWPILFKFG